MVAMSSRSACVPPTQAMSPAPPARLRLTVGGPGSEGEPDNDSGERTLQDGFWEHGRFYGSWKPRKYVFPIDKVHISTKSLQFLKLY